NRAISSGEQITEETFFKFLDNPLVPDADLIIRTGGEKRLSNFLMWQSAYSEFEFLDILWPDFKKENFYNSIINFQQKNRRFGGLNNEEN
ncbi:MAG: undecaprenyl diphosphate synthase family protein, partial [Treponemataceae bacterium]|nr:undecaprenyl diphosphate synthase family protein [Treponemataceae bacterium]